MLLTSYTPEFSALSEQISIWTNSTKDHQIPDDFSFSLEDVWSLELSFLIQRECCSGFLPAGRGAGGYRLLGLHLEANLQVRGPKYEMHK